MRPSFSVSPSQMSRVDVICFLLHGRRKTAFLEIGVRRGDCFCEIRAWRKVAVDPKFRLKRRDYWRWRNLFSSTYFECTSDDFFAKCIDGCPVRQFDVVFIDGLHTHEQSLRDVQHSLHCLKPNGWIILHDCNPLSKAAAVPARSYQDAAERFGLKDSGGAWNGDVWKTVVNLRSKARDLQIVVLDCDEGLCLIRRGQPEDVLDISPERLCDMNYDDLERDRVHLLNLKPAHHLFTLVP